VKKVVSDEIAAGTGHDPTKLCARAAQLPLQCAWMDPQGMGADCREHRPVGSS
jgi:hypothetical protein